MPIKYAGTNDEADLRSGACRNGGAFLLADMPWITRLAPKLQAYPIPSRYQNIPGAYQVYDALCKTLSNRMGDVNWKAFTSAEWGILPKMAHVEGVGPLLYWQFMVLQWPAGCPAKTAAELMGQYYQVQQKNAQLFNELERILEILNEANIPVILLKGTHLAKTIYPDIGLRPMEDLDIFVPRGDLERAFSLVRQLGFEEYAPEMIPGLNLETGHHYHLKNQSGVLLELHWNLVSGGRNDFRTPPTEWFWTQSNTITRWNNSRAQPLSLHIFANLLYLSAHIALQHGNANAYLIWFFDVHALIQDAGPEMDWHSLDRKARELGWNPVVKTVLDGVQQRFGTPIPQGYFQAAGGAEAAITAFIENKSRQSTPIDRARNTLAPYRGLTKIKVFLGHIFPSPALVRYLYHPQPEWLWPLCYPRWWWRIILKISASLHARNPGA